MITKSCSFEKEEAKAQEFVLTPLQVPLLQPFRYNLKMDTHPFLTGQQSEVQPSSEQHWEEEGVCGGWVGGLGRNNG